ncbi:hypothetical protein SELMODRAFT_404485 [Selaginella moellendorffii]|uniref:Amino acid transporter transmembrane domain-containing protein n=1 Tax=Selaginella moellendorffii TaxID=88036 RepID=D8QVH5_SELML|nr:hypothetical protein SELMODRAFT_404485 [Selaginella moellendorffii]
MGNALDCQQFLNTALWDGHLAQHWLCHSPIAQILLTIPFSYAQAGLPSSIAFQLHEVLGGLLGKWWSVATLVVMVPFLFVVCVIELSGCSNIVFEINDQFPKRTWTVIFGALFSLSIIMPSAQNYRAWSFVGVIATVYTSCYQFIVFGILSSPLYLFCEKFFRVHNSKENFGAPTCLSKVELGNNLQRQPEDHNLDGSDEWTRTMASIAAYSRQAGEVGLFTKCYMCKSDVR